MSRMRTPSTTATLDADGRLQSGDASIFLTVQTARLAVPLVACFGGPVAADVLRQAGWTEPPSAGAFRLQVSRLRRQVRSVGLRLDHLGGGFYVLRADEGSPPGRPMPRLRPRRGPR
jgi:hypothetical protein